MDQDNQIIEQKPAAKKGLKKEVVAAIIIGVGLIGGGLIYFWQDISAIFPESSKPVAIVNGEEISRESFEKKVAQVSLGTQAELDSDEKEQILHFMIDDLLLFQDARQKGIEAETEKVDFQFNEIISWFDSEEEFEETLQSEGISRQELIKEIEKQFIFQQYTELITEDLGIVVTSQEVNDLYEEFGGEESLPLLQEVWDELEQYLLDQKFQVELEKIISELREKATIQKFL